MVLHYQTIFFILMVFHGFGQSRFAKGETVSDFELTGYDGSIVSIASTESKVIILDFWASWCGPCVKSIKTTLKPIYKEFDRNELDIIGISNDQVESKWRKAIETWKLPWKNVWDADKNLVRTYQVKGIPTYVVIDQNGKVFANGIPSWELKNEVKKALKAMKK